MVVAKMPLKKISKKVVTRRMATHACTPVKLKRLKAFTTWFFRDKLRHWKIWKCERKIRKNREVNIKIDQQMWKIIGKKLWTYIHIYIYTYNINQYNHEWWFENCVDPTTKRDRTSKYRVPVPWSSSLMDPEAASYRMCFFLPLKIKNNGLVVGYKYDHMNIIWLKMMIINDHKTWNLICQMIFWKDPKEPNRSRRSSHLLVRTRWKWHWKQSCSPWQTTVWSAAVFWTEKWLVFFFQTYVGSELKIKIWYNDILIIYIICASVPATPPPPTPMVLVPPSTLWWGYVVRKGEQDVVSV